MRITEALQQHYSKKIKKLSFLLLISLLFLFLSGCEEMFTGNLFSSLDGPPSANEILSSKDPLSGLEDAAESPKFYEELLNDPQAKQDVVDFLTNPSTGYDPSGEATTENEQRAALLHADIELETSEGQNAVNNMASLFFDQEGDSFDFETVMESIIPPAAKSDKDTFTKMINSMVSAGDAYTSFGTGLSSADPPADCNMGETAQAAAMTIMIAEVVEKGDSADDLWNASHSGDYSGLNATSSDPFDTMDGDESTAFDNIMNAAGLSGLF